MRVFCNHLLTAAAVGFALLLGAAPRAEAAATDTVLLLHGYNSSANGSGGNDAWNCRGIWANQDNILRATGISGRIRTVGYYSDNFNCDINLQSTVYTKNFLGDSGVRRQDAPTNITVLTRDTSLRHVAYRFAWAVAKEYRDFGRPVRVIADSLGGLVVRQAVSRASSGDPDFPSLAAMPILGVYSYGVPHGGTIAGAFSGTTQGIQAVSDSQFMRDLNSTAGSRVGNARWHSFTSEAFNFGDRFISSDSACWVRSVACYRYRNPAYSHGAYFSDPNRTQVINNAYLLRLPATQSWSQGRSVSDVGAAAVAAELILSGG
ncbi:hypothetical protein [Aquimonas sp.]|uniref:hypothetical protein n=1 Tax=Aquimonas sp. TaxID=1872588 RepID=UPI0037BEF9B0